MKQVVIDTNVFISAILNPKGSPAAIFKLEREKKIKILVFHPILQEYRKTLSYPHLQKKHGLSTEQIGKKMLRLVKYGKFINPETKLDIIADDPDDNIFLECAVAGEVDYIISGGKHLKDLKNFSGIKILDPAAFLNISGHDHD
ncbi:MAG: putative toxin-antitoxin system toxin component, PIN family [Nitrospinae bacterium]|nr:putative toxin-antitoxin system toxin component, PIN family [Nitrospinota bacterium]